jgi:hypothetical protein
MSLERLVVLDGEGNVRHGVSIAVSMPKPCSVLVCCVP